MAIIETEKLSKYYGKSRGIIDLDLKVEKGEIFGFIGPNGAGKSTTIRTLLGLISPTSGTARIFGHDIAEKGKILPQLGYISSGAMFYGGMRVSEIIRFSAALRKKDCSCEAEKLCRRLQLDTDKKIDELSLGNRMKVGIVSALQHKPKLYILDEPTSGLDPLMQKEFFALLKERNEEGVTVFLSSHVLSEIQQYCHRAAVIREGKIIACDEVSVLTKSVARRVTLHGVAAPPELDGVFDLSTNGNAVSFLYKGEAAELVAALQGMQLRDLTITEPSLEDSFIRFYKEGGEDNDSIQA